MGQSKTRISHTPALVAETATRGRSAHPAQGPDVALSWADALSGWNHSSSLPEITRVSQCVESKFWRVLLSPSK